MILYELSRSGRITYTELAKKVGMSPAGALKKVKSLESLGVIKGYSAIIDHEVLGLKLKLLIFVKCESGKYPEVARKIASELDNRVLEVHEITGDYDILVKTIVMDRNEARKVIEHIASIDNVISTTTSMVLDTIVERPSIVPLNP